MQEVAFEKGFEGWVRFQQIFREMVRSSSGRQVTAVRSLIRLSSLVWKERGQVQIGHNQAEV